MEIKIGDKKFTLKDKISGQDFLNSLSIERKESMEMNVRLLAEISISPKLTFESITSLSFVDFNEFMAKSMSVFGIKEQVDFLEEK